MILDGVSSYMLKKEVKANKITSPFIRSVYPSFFGCLNKNKHQRQLGGIK